MKNIRDILWEGGTQTVDEYLARRYFYDSLNKAGAGSRDNLDFNDELLLRVETIDSSVNDYNMGGKGATINIQDFGWKEYYTKDVKDYLEGGYNSFDIYDD